MTQEDYDKIRSKKRDKENWTDYLLRMVEDKY